MDGHQGHYVRTYLAAAQSGCCAICGGTTVWLNLPLAFVVDNVDGNPENYHRANLRLICPNCDSRLPTYTSRTRGHGRSTAAGAMRTVGPTDRQYRHRIELAGPGA